MCIVALCVACFSCLFVCFLYWSLNYVALAGLKLVNQADLDFTEIHLSLLLSTKFTFESRIVSEGGWQNISGK